MSECVRSCPVGVTFSPGYQWTCPACGTTYRGTEELTVEVVESD